ncbi:Ldh family oxidoreductase [Kitasatospora aureofaciens]|uniref:Ldh family oxidoreductase n=1 Tax=Kitasatospora aureofaciens TaxID=1894 RepID=UPI001C45DD7D|nr:Ldh family oxidoreductase [Kitasatospora aureofaciens]MBV6701286.1 Ldh family oxidoreductase [Kitasatospora aureofaciens]
MTEAAGRQPALRVADLIVAEGPEGAERILIPGLTATVAAGEIVAALADDPASAAALVEVLAGERRAQYGEIVVGGGGRPRRVAPARPSGVAVVRPGQHGPAAGRTPVVAVVDATGTRPGAADGAAAEARTAAGQGSAVLLVAVDAEVAGVADRVVYLNRPPRPVTACEPAEQEIRFTPEALTEAAIGSLAAAGVDAGRAALVARILVDADVRGHFSHGVGLLPMYLDRLERGGIDPVAEPGWISEDGPVTVLDARGGFGQVAAELAADTCSRRAAETGLAAVAVRGNNHIGMLAAYREHFVRHGVVGLVLNISGPSVAAPGAGRPTLGNDAVCMVVPRAEQRPLVVDFATGTVASGKIRHAAHRGEPVPATWLVDRQGRPTTDPEELDRGGAVPVFGGHKGLGVAVITEVLAGILAGGTVSPLVHKQRGEPERSMDCSQLFLALSPAAFGNPPVDELLGVLSGAIASGYPQGAPAVHLPEQQEELAESAAREHGVPVPASVVERLGWAADRPLATAGGAR